MNYLRFFIACFVLLGVSQADAGVIVSQNDVALSAKNASVDDWNPSNSQDEDRPYLHSDQSQGMSATSISLVKSSNSPVLNNEAQQFPRSFKICCRVDYENAKLPPSPILDGLIRPS